MNQMNAIGDGLAPVLFLRFEQPAECRVSIDGLTLVDGLETMAICFLMTLSLNSVTAKSGW